MASNNEPKADFIDLANVKEKLAEWNPDAPNQLWAIVDMGSNGIRFSITSLAKPTPRLLKSVYADRAPISLLDALEDGPREGQVSFPDETIKLVATTLARFKYIATDYGVPPEQTMVLATEAMRRAANVGAMLAEIEKQAPGLKVSVLEGRVETLCGAVMGCRSGLVNVDGGALFLDLGGGSVQMTWVDTELPGYEIKAAENGVSLPFGAAALMKILEDKDKGKCEASIKDLQDKMLEAYNKLRGQFPGLDAIAKKYENNKHDKSATIDVYMCGGGFRGYGSMLMHNDATNPYPIPSTNSYTVPGELFKQVDKMRKVNHDYKGKIFGMSSRRRNQFPAIATVIDSFIKTVPNIGKVTFSGGSNRQGALMMKLPLEIRESNPLLSLASKEPVPDRDVVEAVTLLLSQALPREVDFSRTPTVFTEGLAPLLVRELWGREGNDGDSNTSYALNNAIIRDPDVPGLTHVHRGLLALSESARWAGNLGPVDAQLFESVTSLLANYGEDAPFWAGYIGAVANVICTVLPAFPKSAQEVSNAIRISAHLKEKEDKKDKVIVAIGISSDYGKGIDTKELSDLIEGVAKKRGGKKAHFKVSAEISLLP